jgi:hypothetical protein
MGGSPVIQGIGSKGRSGVGGHSGKRSKPGGSPPVYLRASSSQPGRIAGHTSLTQ